MSPSVSLHVARELWNVRFVHLLAIEGVFQFATYMLNPVITGYVVLLGASLATGGFVAGLVATSSLVVRPFTGMVADRLSKTTLLVVAAALFTAAAFGCARAESVAWISAFRIVQGVAFAFRSAVVVSLVSVTVSRDHVGRAVGWVGMVTMVSSAIAPSVASWVGDAASYHACFLVAGALFSCGLVLAVLFKLPKDVRAQRREAAVRAQGGQAEAAGARPQDVGGQAETKCGKARRLHGVGAGRACAGANRRMGLRDFVYVPAVPYSVMAALSGAPHAINVSLILTVGDCRGIAGISLYFAFYSVATLIMRPLVGRICDPRGFDCVIVPVLLVDLAGTLCLAGMQSLPMVALAGVLVGVGQGSAYSALQAEAVRHARVGELGRASNTFYIGPDVNMGMTPFVAGFVMQLLGVTAMYVVCFALVSGALLLALAMKRRP